MLPNCPSCCWTFVCSLVIATVSASSLTSSDDVVPKTPWDMSRFGRGLQMLRLGKRTSDAASVTSGTSLTDEEQRQVSEWLKSALSDMSRDQTRRQPPLPRYGRELNLRRELLAELLEAMSSSSSYMRPAPRGGRYRRSVDDSNRFLSGGQFPEGGPGADHGAPFGLRRSVVRPRIGRYLHNLNRQEKAIARPRIGRQQQQTMDKDGAARIDAILNAY